MLYDTAIVGAGAAGLMTAIQAAEGGLSVLLLEGQSKVGAKILMSGGTRCNVTNMEVSEKDFNSEQPRVVRNILRAFTNEATIRFFEGLGVELLLEPTGKYFPSSNSGKTVLEALLRRAHALKVTLLCNHKVQALKFDGREFVLKGDHFLFKASKVVLTTGGLSYPTTGSDGTGYRLAQGFGHPMVRTSPALTPLTTNDQDFKSLAGISLEAALTLFSNGKKVYGRRDSFLFTHLGFSGPAALDISRHWLNAQGHKKIEISFLPAHNDNSLLALWQQAALKTPRKTVKGLLMESMPQRLAELLLKKNNTDGAMAIGQCPKDLRQALMAGCLHYPLDISGVVGYIKAEVTAGGLDFNAICPKTLESKLRQGLFFAGEILDVDGRIGGFNFQWAWASGHAVAQALIQQKGSLNEQKNH